MKRITITYHMEKGSETAESCITVPMTDKALEGLRQFDRDGVPHYGHASVLELISSLALLAGYDTGTYVGHELSPIQYEEADY